MDIGSIMDSVGAIGSGAIAGPLGIISGIVGSGVNAFIMFKTQKQKNAHDLSVMKERRLDMEKEAAINKQEAEAALERDKVVATIKENEIEGEAFINSMKGANKTLFKESYMAKLGPTMGGIVAFMFALVDFLKSSIRPVLTYLFVWIGLDILFPVLDAAKPETLQAMTGSIILTFIFLMVTTVTWHFADRRVAKFLMRLNDGNQKG